MNNLSDALNSSNLCVKNRNKVPLSEKNVHIKKILKDALNDISSLKTTSHNVPPCFKGLIQTITACLMLYEDLKQNYKVEYLLTRRLTQDGLENTFAIFRQRGGFNDNPTAKTFRLSFRHLFCANLKKTSRSSNCEDDHLQFIFSVRDVGASSFTPLENTDNTYSESDFQNISDEDLLHTLAKNDVTLEDCAVRYTAGFILQKCLLKHKCSVCNKTLKNTFDPPSHGLRPVSTKRRTNTEFIKQKAYVTNGSAFGNLCLPNNIMNDVVKLVLKVFAQYYDQLKSRMHVLDILFKISINVVKKCHPAFLEVPVSCNKHREFIIRYTLLVRLQKQTSWDTAFIKRTVRGQKLNNKIRKLNHN